jgi:hypothetical protein
MPYALLSISPSFCTCALSFSITGQS